MVLSQRIANEINKAHEKLNHLDYGISIFGGARVKEGTEYYKAATELANLLVCAGFPVITGGGPGIMQAANEGAFKAACLSLEDKSVGLNIVLPFEQSGNPFQNISLEFNHFASRKVAFCRHSWGFVYCPGGFGTIDELGEVLTLIQTGKMPKSPIVLFNSEFWNGLIEWLRQTVMKEKLIGENDLDLFFITDDPYEAVEYFKNGKSRFPCN